jgi:hypothetical protein
MPCQIESTQVYCAVSLSHFAVLRSNFYGPFLEAEPVSTKAQNVILLLRHIKELMACRADAEAALRMIATGVDANGQRVDCARDIAEAYFDRHYPPVRVAANTK